MVAVRLGEASPLDACTPARGRKQEGLESTEPHICEPLAPCNGPCNGCCPGYEGPRRPQDSQGQEPQLRHGTVGITRHGIGRWGRSRYL